MKPPYDITNTILEHISAISEKLGEVKANFLSKPDPQLRKQNKIKTIYSSLSIEGNTLTQEQITAVLDNKRVIGPQKDITEVLNANTVYNRLKELNPYSIIPPKLKSLLFLKFQSGFGKSFVVFSCSSPAF